MGDYVKSKLKQIKELLKVETIEHDDDVEIILDKIYEDGFQDGQNEGGNESGTEKKDTVI